MKLAPKTVLVTTASILTGCGLLPSMPFNNGPTNRLVQPLIRFTAAGALEGSQGPAPSGTESGLSNS